MFEDFDYEPEQEVDPGIDVNSLSDDEKAVLAGDGYDCRRLEYMRSNARKQMIKPKSSYGGMGYSEEKAWEKFNQFYKEPETREMTSIEQMNELRDNPEAGKILKNIKQTCRCDTEKAIQLYLKHHRGLIGVDVSPEI